MKIDLHCHTKKTKTCEKESRNVTIELFKEKVEEAEVKMVGITNHNYFNKDEYLLFRDFVKDNCYVLPGIELDVEGNLEKTKGHIILISDPNQVDLFNDKLVAILKNIKPDDFCINSHALYEAFKDMDIIYIAHFLKDKQLSEADLEDLKSIMKYPLRLLKEAANIVSIGVLQSNNHRAMIGSDVVNWSEYEKYSFAELKFDVQDFRHFLKLVDKDSLLISDLINENFNEKVKVYGKSEKKEFPFIIPIYDDVNIIFGDKGSGKTEILESLKNYYELKGLKYTTFSGGDKQGWYKEKIGIDDLDYSYINLNLDSNYKNEILEIKSFADTNPVSIKNYYKYFKNDSTNKKKKRMKCLEVDKMHSYSDKIYKGLYNDINSINSFISKANNFEYKKINSEEIEILIKQLEVTKSHVYENYKEIWIEENSKRLLDDFIDKMNCFVSQNIGSPSMPTETGLCEFIKNRLNLNKNVDSVLKLLNNTKNEKDVLIGKLGLKGEVNLTTKYTFINSNNKKDIDSKTLRTNKTELSNIITELEKINNDITSNKISNNIKIIKENISKLKIADINDFISISKSFTINKNQYTPSKGELAILSLQHDLLSKKDYDIFLIDEPEANLGSAYINEEIVPLIKDLASSKKVLVIATHDANIAIRTRPSCSILKIVDNGEYRTYIGNMFTDTLKEIRTGEELSWKEESIKYLEGGKEAFEERGDLYA